MNRIALCSIYILFFNHFYNNQITLSLSNNLQTTRSPIAINPSSWPERFPAKEYCSKCGLCETSFIQNVTTSCAFLNGGMKRNLDTLEPIIHGRSRKLSSDELRFGVMTKPILLGRGVGIEDAQWTGCVTAIAKGMIMGKLVDAVVCVGSKDGDWSDPEPIIARTVEDVLRGRGVKPALAPSLKILDEIKADKSIRKLLFCGVGCAVQAFRAIQNDLGLDKVYVLGTNCADNSPTPNAAKNFIENGLGIDSSSVRGYEFMQDFQVHIKQNNNEFIKKPYFCLPGTIAKEAIAKSCLSCFDYTNGLADVVIGYMAAPINTKMTDSMQSITIRNEIGQVMIDNAIQYGLLELYGDADEGGSSSSSSSSYESFALSTLTSDAIITSLLLPDEGQKAKEKGLPIFIGEIMAFLLSTIGPKGINFAKYSIDYHILRNYLYCLYYWEKQEKRNVEESLPLYAKNVVDTYLAYGVFSTLVDEIRDDKNKE